MGHEILVDADITVDMAVPAQNAAANVSINDVIGNKTDTVAGDSIIAIGKQNQTKLVTASAAITTIDSIVDAIKLKTDTIPSNPTGATDIAVPTADAATNTNMRDVVGNKSDTVGGTSLIALEKLIISYIGNPSAHTLKSIIAKLGDDPSTVKLRFDGVITAIAGLPFAVDGADSANNLSMRDVIGSKLDTVAGNSIVSYVKGVLAGLLVSAKNSVGNTNIADVIGNKTDDEDGTSLFSNSFITKTHNHAVQLCTPTLAAGLNVTAGAGAWTLGNYVVLMATNAITSPFDIHMVHIGTFSANDIYELVLYSGANGSESIIAHVRFSRTNATNQGSILPCITPLLPANTQVKVKLASATGGNNVNFSVMYHVY